MVKHLTEFATSISAGGDHSLICTKSGHLLASGWNDYGQLGTGDDRSTVVFTPLKDMEHISVIDVLAGHQHSACISSNRELYIWGTEWFGEFKIPHLVKSIKGRWEQVCLGKNFGGVVTEKGEIYVWGNNSWGQLGVGDWENRPTPVKLATLKNKAISSIACGHLFTIALGETFWFKSKPSGKKRASSKKPIKKDTSNQSKDLFTLSGSKSSKTPKASKKSKKGIHKIPPIKFENQQPNFDQLTSPTNDLPTSPIHHPSSQPPLHSDYPSLLQNLELALSKISSQDSHLAHLSSQNTHLQNQLTEGQTSLAHLTSQLDQLKSENARLKSSDSQVISNMQETIGQMQQRERELEGEIERLQREVEKERDRQEGLEEFKRDRQAVELEYTLKWTRFQTEIEELETMVGNKQREHEQLIDDYEGMQREFESMQARLRK
jgi:hypothetical protein